MSQLDTERETVEIKVDGKSVSAYKGEMVIAAAERAGVFIPRFCYHPRMRSVGMCRMCLVEMSGPRGFSLVPACFQPVADGQEIVTTSEKVRKAQDGVLEFLLVNHPLDCPVCDKGGECPLQDQTLAYGPGESRFVEEKRHWAKPIPISRLVDLDRERCIQCDRCTRFAREVAGDPFIAFQGRGDHIEVNTFPERPFSSYFSGNTVQICPVGALTASPYRFKARPWDLEQVESTCTTCSLGCRVSVQSSAGRVVRYLGVDVDAVNQSWLCDRGRFGFEWLDSPNRRSSPLLRRDEAWEETSWAHALSEVGEKLRSAVTKAPSSIGLLGGARLANEDAYAWAKLAKGVLGTDSVDAQLGDGIPAELVQGLPRASLEELSRARVVVLACGDVREELPVLFLRLRQLAEGPLSLVELSPFGTSLSSSAAASIRYRPGGLGDLVETLLSSSGTSSDPALRKAKELIGRDGGEGVVVLLGRASLDQPEVDLLGAASGFRSQLPRARFLPLLRRGNVQGALDAGLAPGFLPGRVRLEDGAEHFRAAWGAVPSQKGLGAGAMLQAAAAGEIEVLVLLGSDPLSDFPDQALAKAALERAAYVVSIETVPNASSPLCDVILPAAGHSERPGTTTNVEGRVTTLGQKVVAPGVSWPDWMIAVELAASLGNDFGFSCVEDVWDELQSLSPLHAGLPRAVMAGAAGRDGVVLPVATMASAGIRPTVPLDPMAIPGLLSVETQGSASFSGSAVAYASSTSRALVQPTMPAMSVWEPSGGTELPAPSDGLLLLRVRRLYDGGTLVQECQSLSGLALPPVARALASELSSRGLSDGDRAVLRRGVHRFSLVVRADDDLADGIVVVDDVGTSEELSALLGASGPVELERA